MPIPLPIQCLFFFDPAGNHYAVYTPKAPTQNANGATGRMTGVGYIEFEAPDVAASIQFYTTVLGFALINRSEDTRQATPQDGERPDFDPDPSTLLFEGTRHEPQSARTAYRVLRSGCELERSDSAVGAIGDRQWRPRCGQGAPRWPRRHVHGRSRRLRDPIYYGRDGVSF